MKNLILVSIFTSSLILSGNAKAMQPAAGGGAAASASSSPGFVVAIGTFVLSMAANLRYVPLFWRLAPLPPDETHAFIVLMGQYRRAHDIAERRAAVDGLRAFFRQCQIQVTIVENPQEGAGPITHTARTTVEGGAESYYQSRLQRVFDMVQPSPRRQRNPEQDNDNQQTGRGSPGGKRHRSE